MEDLLKYNAKCNDIYAHFILEHNLAHKKIIELFSHIQNAQQIWNERILGEQPSVGPWDMVVMKDAFEINKLNFHTSLSILQNKELSEVIKYSTKSGKEFESSVENILFHMINHSTHHRAQIGNLMPKFGVEPPATDFILYARSKKQSV